MSRGKRAYLRPDLRLEAGLSQKFDLPPPGIQVTTRSDERLSEKRDEPFGSRRGRIEVPRPEIGVFEDHPTAGSDEAEIARELVRGTPQRPDLEPAMHEIESVRVKLAVEQIVMRERHVGEMVLLDERVSRIQKLGVDVDSHHGAVRTDPLAQEAKPTETATAYVERPKALAAPETIEQCTPGRLPHAGLELEAFEFRHLTGQEIR
jgi:hypothetical protein